MHYRDKHRQESTTQPSEPTKKLKISRTIKFLVVAVALLLIGVDKIPRNFASINSNYTAPQARLENPIAPPEAQPVDEVVAAEVAASIAEAADLLVADGAINRADTLTSQIGLASINESQNSTATIEKPQLIAPSAKTAKDIKTIETKEGDTLASLAAQNGITEDTIRWANNLRSDSIKPGTKLTILPVTGVLHTVKASETADILASMYQASAEQITAFNDLELTGLQPGARIIIPNGVKAGTSSSRAGSTGAGSTRFSWGGGGVVFAGNRYAYGYCTYYAFNKRAEAGRPIGSNWGNATSWASLARASGFTVNKTPAAGAIIQNSGGWNGYGHVGYVERVNPDGSLFVSDMNYVGWNKISTRTVPADQVGLFNYIH